MSSFWLIVLAAIILYLLVRQWRAWAYIKELQNAIDGKRPYLISREKGKWQQLSGLTRLTHSVNKLIDERQRFLQEEAGYLHQIEITMSSLTESVLIVDARCRITMANAAARKLLSLPENCQGKQLERFLSSARFLEYFQAVQTGQILPPREIEIRNSLTQSSLFVEISGTRITSAGSTESMLTLIVLHDITRLKSLENVRREFVANVSHELRTPVTIIKGYADALVEDHERLAPEEQLRFLAKIQKNVHRLHLLLEDLLALSRLERGQNNANLSAVDLRALIGEQVENFSAQLGEGQRVQCDFSKAPRQAMLDPIKIAQVIRNVLDNTLRYAKGFTEVAISASETNGNLVIAIEDDGCGIPEKDLAHVFERFYTVDKGRSRELGGTGLGLSIVKHIVQLHGGQVSANNRVPRGLRIELRIPLK